MIPFNKALCVGGEEQYVVSAIRSQKISGDGEYSKYCQDWFEKELGCEKALLTPSCTHALEMAALLINVQEGDEIIMPSYTFVSTANAFVLRGARIVFVDIRPDTMNINEELIEAAITDKTKAIVPVHYAGVACEMDVIMSLSERYGLYVIEDAAQGMMSTYKGRALGSIGHIGAYSFHETKNYTSGGEGGLLIINDGLFAERAEIIREKGTNRSLFFRGGVDKYSWVDIGSSYLPSDIQAAYLWGQLNKAEDVNSSRLELWSEYYTGLLSLVKKGVVVLPSIPEGCSHNAHMFYLKVRNVEERTEVLNYLKSHGIQGAFHYVPLHSAVAGPVYSYFDGEDTYTTRESERLIRLPIWYGMKKTDVHTVIRCVGEYFS